MEQVYHAALERGTDERAFFLAQACSDDAALRREVEALLASNEQASGFLIAPALELEARNLAAESLEEQLAVQIGQELSPKERESWRAELDRLNQAKELNKQK